jgi:hypothetical protein
MLAALQSTAVPLSGTLGQTKLGSREAAALNDALTMELNRTLAVAMPPATVLKQARAGGPARSARRGAAATPAPAADALDDLIAGASLDAGDELPETDPEATR